MRFAFLVAELQLGGGNIVVTKLARQLVANGHAVDVVGCRRTSGDDEFYTFDGVGFRQLHQLGDSSYDLALATFWPTAYLIGAIKASAYAYLIQSYETRFFPRTLPLLRRAAEESYRLGLRPIVIADWIGRLLPERGDVPVLRYGVDHALFQPSPIDSAPDRPFRLLIEGPLGVPLKNTEEAIACARLSTADEVWLLTGSDVTAVPGVDRLFSRASREEVAAIMTQCDALLKLSLVEGQAMPPVEMALSGRPSILSDLEGYHEYLTSGESAFIIAEPYREQVIAAIDRLKRDRTLLASMGRKARASVEDWPSWPEATARFEQIAAELAQDRRPIRPGSRLSRNVARAFVYGRASVAWPMRTLLRTTDWLGSLRQRLRPRALTRQDFA